MIAIVPATKDHLQALYEVPPGSTVRALAMLSDGRPIAVGGQYWSNGNTVIFMNATDEARHYPNALTKVCKSFLANVHGVVFAHCDATIEAAPRFLRYLGFEPIKDSLWRRPSSR